MFGKSYSDQALQKFIKVIVELDREIDPQLAEYPVEGIRPQSELVLDGVDSIFNKQKKADRLNRFIWSTGIWIYLIDYYYDGKQSHKDKFLKEGIKAVAPIARGDLFKTLKKHSKNTSNSFYREGLLWGEEFNKRFLSGSLSISKDEFEIEEDEVDDGLFGKEGKIISVIAPRDKEFYQKDKILIDQTYFDRKNPDIQTYRSCDFRYVNELNMHLLCRRGESNFYFELYSDLAISGVFDLHRDVESLGYDDELTLGKEIYQFETKDQSLPDQIELKVRKSKKFSDDLLRDIEYELEEILKKIANPLSNLTETLLKSSKYKDKINFSDSKNTLNQEYLNELFFGREIIIEQILEEVIEHLNDSMDMSFEIKKETNQFKGLSDLKILHEGYCFLRRRQRIIDGEHEDWRYGWESGISQYEYFDSYNFSISFITETFTNVTKHHIDGLLDKPSSRLNLESIYSQFHQFKRFSLHKLNPIQNECHEWIGEFKLRFYEWMRFNNQFDYFFLIIMNNPLQNDDFSVDSKVILKIEGNTERNECDLMGMSLDEHRFDSEEGYFSSNNDMNFENDIESHLINPLKILIENKTESNSYLEIYMEHLHEKVLSHGEFVKYPRDEIIKDFNNKT